MSEDYTEHEKVVVRDGTEPGDQFEVITRMTTENNGQLVDFIAMKQGHIESVQTVDGETVLARRETNTTVLGASDTIGELATALSELDEKISN